MIKYFELPIERMELFEENLGVNIQNSSAFINENRTLEINGELHLNEGTELKQDIQLVISAHDSQGRVINSIRTPHIEANSFFGFELFSARMGYASGYYTTVLPCTEILTKVRIYPVSA